MTRPESNNVTWSANGGSTIQRAPGQRLFALDVLRGVAVLLVIIYHMGLFKIDEAERAGVPSLAPATNIAETIWDLIYPIGWTGVDLFFVLSGFLISGLLFKEFQQTGSLNVRRFWLRRGLKIWPSYFAAYGLMVFLCCCDDLRLRDWDKPLARVSDALPNIFLVQNYFSPDVRWPNSWSLAIEEHFYLSLPLVLLGVSALVRSIRGSRGTYQFEGLFFGGAVVCAFILILRLMDAGREVPNAYFPTHLRADSLCFGVMLGYLCHYRKPLFCYLGRFWPVCLMLVPAALVTVSLLPGQGPGNYVSSHTVGFTLLYLAFGALVIGAGTFPEAGLGAPVAVRLPLKVLAFVGVYSYTIYLAQAIAPRIPGFYTVAHSGARSFIDSEWSTNFVFLAFSLGLGILLSHLIERPMLALRDRWLPGHSATRKTRPDKEQVAARSPVMSA